MGVGTYPFEALLQVVIDEQGDELRRLLVHVDEGFKCLRRVSESAVG